MTGYLNPLYAESLAEFGTPRELPHSGGWVLTRKIPGSAYCDAMGCYPIFSCRDWTGLEADLDELRPEFVSLAMVADPFGNHDRRLLRRCFPDVVLRYKDHFVVDLSAPLHRTVSVHHRRNAEKALKSLEVRTCPTPMKMASTWQALYATLVKRHEIRGIAAFSEASLGAQLSVPGLTAFEAVHAGRTVGMLLWYTSGSVAYYHLGAHNEVGYSHLASFGLFWHAVEHFAGQGLRWLDLGAGAGVAETNGGLTRFKRGWSTGTRPALFCGRIFEHSAYRTIARRTGNAETTDYFPAYRKGEFN